MSNQASMPGVVALFAVLGASDEEMDAAISYLRFIPIADTPSGVYNQAKEALKTVRRELDRT